jgi:hypothetical protein
LAKNSEAAERLPSFGFHSVSLCLVFQVADEILRIYCGFTFGLLRYPDTPAADLC